MNWNPLNTASQEPAVKRLVYNSSSEAAVFSSSLERDEKQPARIIPKLGMRLRSRGFKAEHLLSHQRKDSMSMLRAGRWGSRRSGTGWRIPSRGLRSTQVNSSLPSLCRDFDTSLKFYRRSASGLDWTGEARACVFVWLANGNLSKWVSQHLACPEAYHTHRWDGFVIFP